MASPPYMLGIETSCDETACALVDRRGRIKVNSVASQWDLHAQFGGIVPEVASRRHVEACLPMIDTVLHGEGVAGWDDVAAIAVTQGPGLIGCLLMGVETAKALAWRYDKPLYAVHHLEAHFHAPFLLPEDPASAHLLLEDGKQEAAIPLENSSAPSGDPMLVKQPAFPFMGLLVSGGHTTLALVRGPGICETIATTRDDAVGEAYDKVARAMNLGYPGGPIVDRLAAEGDPKRFAFRPPLKRRDVLDFSFSGLKTAVARKVESLRETGNGEKNNGLDEATVRDLCAGFQATVIDVLLSKSISASRRLAVRDLVIAGGVAANKGLRRAARKARRPGLRIWFPHFSLCTDNAAMIAGLAWHLKPLAPGAALRLDPQASLPFSSEARA